MKKEWQPCTTKIFLHLYYIFYLLIVQLNLYDIMLTSKKMYILSVIRFVIQAQIYKKL